MAGFDTLPMVWSRQRQDVWSITDTLIDVFVSARRDVMAARRFFQRAIGTTKVTPVEVVTDQAATYPMVLEELLAAAWHRTERYVNNRVE